MIAIYVALKTVNNKKLPTNKQNSPFLLKTKNFHIFGNVAKRAPNREDSVF
jgi:hypothetical protein